MHNYILGGELEPPTAILWVYHFLAQHFDYLRDSKRAMEYINKALEHTPTLIEAYMVKARIYKVLTFFRLTVYLKDWWSQNCNCEHIITMSTL